MKKQYIIKELNTNLYWCGYCDGDEPFIKYPIDAYRYDKVWKAEDTIQSALVEKMEVIVVEPMFEIVTVYVNA